MCKVALIGLKRAVRLRYDLAGVLIMCLAASASGWANGSARQNNGMVRQQQPPASTAANTIRRSLGFYRSLSSFSVDCELDFRVKKGSFSGGREDRYSVAMQRPNRLAVLSAETNQVSVVCDGSRVFTYIAGLNSYESAPAPASVADIHGEAIHKNSEQLDPVEYLRPLLDYGRPDVLADGATVAEPAGTEIVEGFSCLHIRFAGKGCAWQVWVEEGARPMVHKFECDVSASEIGSSKTDPEMAGATMQVIARYRNWRLNPELPADTFKFAPPAGGRSDGIAASLGQ